MTARVSWMILAVVGVVAMADATPRDTVPPPEDDFLEFLGSWHTGDDRWVDPFQVDEVPGAEQGERNSDIRPRDGRDRKTPQAPPYDSSGQPERESTVPRRDVKP